MSLSLLLTSQLSLGSQLGREGEDGEGYTVEMGMGVVTRARSEERGLPGSGGGRGEEDEG